MAKWLVAGGLVILVLVLLLWRQMQPTEAKATPVKLREPAVALASASTTEAPAGMPAETSTAAKPAVTEPPAEAAKLVAPEATKPAAKPAKLDPRTDEFFYKFDELIPKVVTRNAAKCYEGRHGQLHRNQKLSLRYKVKVVSGEVQIRDVTIKESTLGDPALETCFIQQVQRSTWKDDQLPDVEIDDEVVLRPERGMKKYWQDNIDYVGDEAPRQ